MAVLVLLNNFLHDLSAACWLVGTVLLWFILRKKRAHPDAAIVEVVEILMRMVQFSLLGVILFGIVRAMAYRRYEWNTAAGESQLTLLIGKHIIFAVIVVVGLLFYMRARKVLARFSQWAPTNRSKEME